MKVDSPAIWGLRSIAPPIKAGVWSGCVSARTADVKEWIHICNSCWFGLPTPVWSANLTLRAVHPYALNEATKTGRLRIC